jgi:hypothetical protein
MKRLIVLLIALALVLLSAGVAFAHGGVGFRFYVGLPFFFGYSYPPVYSGYPAAYSYYQPRTDVYVEPSRRGTVIENIYVNGRLVEKRVNHYRDRYDYDRSDERNYDYDRR